MLTLPAELTRRYETLLRQQGVAREHRPYYMKWLCYYWDWDVCHKYGFEPRARQSFPPFDEKLRTKKQSDVQRQQARHVVADTGTSRYSRYRGQTTVIVVSSLHRLK